MSRCRPVQAELVKVQTQGKVQLGAHRRLNMLNLHRGKEMDEDFLVQKSWTLWPEIYSPL